MKPNSTTTSFLNRALTLCLSVVVLALAATTVFAHGGVEHLVGTVVKVADNVLTVKTAKGNVDVKLDGKTELTKSDRKAKLGDLTTGARVVVDIPEGSKDKVAHAVKIGTAAKATDQHAHDSH